MDKQNIEARWAQHCRKCKTHSECSDCIHRRKIKAYIISFPGEWYDIVGRYLDMLEEGEV